MKESINNLNMNIADIESLLDLSVKAETSEQSQAIFRSAVVLLIASWEQYIEQLADKSIQILTDRLRNPDPIPEFVKQSIATFTVPEKRNNSQDFSESVWLFADKGWKTAYRNYCRNKTANLNTASSHNIKDVFKTILGIRDVTECWTFKETGCNECIDRLNNLVELRHNIAHGAKLSKQLKIEDLCEYIEFISTISEHLFNTIFDCVAAISQSQAITYSFNLSCYTEIIALAIKKSDGIITLDEIKSIGTSAQGNHNKLRYEPWDLLRHKNNQERYITDRLLKFYADEIDLPLEILVFDNKESIAKPNTRHIKFSELL